ncbi:MAG: hypothetical protein WA432_03835 [Candidatus Babeliaceae bacterium]
MSENNERNMTSHKFTGHIYIFHAFDVGEDINLERVSNEKLVVRNPLTLSKYFKNYHIPLTVELPNTHNVHCENAKLHNFGVITLCYKIPFNATLEELRTHINDIDDQYHKQSIKDAQILFDRIKNAIKHPHFFHLRKSYVVIQVQPEPEKIDVLSLKDQYGNIIASLLRFETETLSEYQKNEILETAFGYYRGDLILIDTEAAFVYDDEYEDILDIFDFANIQQLELQYFDRVLDKQLNTVYEREVKRLPLKTYLPFIGSAVSDPVSDLGKLRVDISVITERLENSIKLSGEPYYAELYSIITQKLGLKNWKDSINNKLGIIHDIGTVYQHKVDGIREDLLSTSVIVLIIIEIIIGILGHVLYRC